MIASGDSFFYFGKLPQFGDFVRYNAAHPGIADIDVWIQEGLLFSKTKLETSWDSVFLNSPVYNFQLCTPGREFYIGVIKPSKDEAGRKFPFLVARHLYENQLINPGYGFNQFVNFYNSAHQFIKRSSSCISIDQLLETANFTGLGLSENSADQDYSEFLANYTLEQFFTSLFGSFDNEQKYLLFYNISETIAPLSQRGSNNISIGLKFPLIHDKNNINNIVRFWAELSNLMLGQPHFTPSLFWFENDENFTSSLFLFFGWPKSKNFYSLINPDVESDLIVDCAFEETSDIHTIKVNMDMILKSLIERPQLTCDLFLKKMKKHDNSETA